MVSCITQKEISGKGVAEKAREKTPGLRPALVRGTALLLYYSCTVFLTTNSASDPGCNGYHSGLHGKTNYKSLMTHWKSFESIVWAAAGLFSNPTQAAALISKGTAIQTSDCGEMHVHHIMFSTARSHSQPMVREKFPNHKGNLLQGKRRKLPLAAALTL